MDQDRFWELIEQARKLAGPDCGAAAKQVAAVIGELPAAEIFGFERQLIEHVDQAYAWDLRAAAWVMTGGCCGDDTFWDFRNWLICQGRRRFESALADPDSMVDWWDPNNFPADEEMCYVTGRIYKEKTGHPLDLPDLDRPRSPRGRPLPWDATALEADLPERVPRLFAAHW